MSMIDEEELVLMQKSCCCHCINWEYIRQYTRGSMVGVMGVIFSEDRILLPYFNKMSRNNRNR